MTLNEFRTEWLGPDNYITAHTSGSTGKPKEILLSKADMIVSARATNTFFGLDGNSVFVCPLSPDYIAGKMMAVRAWQAGTEPVFVTPSNTPELYGHASLLAVVPSQVPHVLTLTNSRALTVDNLLIGGAALGESLKADILRAGKNAYESYGMTETCSHVALRSVGDTTFHAMPGVRFDVDSRNCLSITHDGMSFGKLQTNDIVDLLSADQFVWRGRFDNVINTGGIKVFPEELEAEISRLVSPSFPFYISSVPSEKWGNEIAVVAACSQALLNELKVSLSQVMDHRCLPKRFFCVTALPQTANGKVRRLAPLQKNRAQFPGEGIAPLSEYK